MCVFHLETTVALYIISSRPWFPPTLSKQQHQLGVAQGGVSYFVTVAVFSHWSKTTNQPLFATL